jgi:predicted nucleic acid-binding protein
VNPLVVDTSVIVATAVTNDPDHAACRALLERLRPTFDLLP